MATLQDSPVRARQNSRRRRRAAERARQRDQLAARKVESDARQAERDALMATVPAQYRTAFVFTQDVEWREHGVVYRGMFGAYLGGMLCTVRVTVRVRTEDGHEVAREECRRVNLAKLRRPGYYGPVYWKVRSSDTGGRYETKPHRLVTSRERLNRTVAGAYDRLSEEERRTVQRAERKLRGNPRPKRERTRQNRTQTTVTRVSVGMSADERRKSELAQTKTVHDWLTDV